MNRSMRVAFCGMATALSVVLVFLTGIIPIGEYVLPALAGLLLIAVVVELGQRWAWSVYAAVSLLSALLSPDKEAALCYILLFGCYPIMKSLIEKKAGKAAVLLKLAVFNAAAVLEFFLAVWLLRVPQDSFRIFGVNLPWLFLLAGNAVFLLYDYAMSLLVTAYFQKFHFTVKKLFHMR